MGFYLMSQIQSTLMKETGFGQQAQVVVSPFLMGIYGVIWIVRMGYLIIMFTELHQIRLAIIISHIESE